MLKKKRLLWMVTILLIFSNFIWLKPLWTMRSELPKATWLWHTSQIGEKPQEILSFLDAHHVDTLYLQIHAGMPQEIYRQFIQQAGQLGIEVYALDGAPHWAIEQKPVLDFFDWLEDYQSRSEKSERFAGVHLDVEPYILGQWSTDYQKTVDSYQDMVLFAAAESDSLGMEFSLDMPFWFDQRLYHNPYGEGILSEWLIDQADSVTIMAYRNKANGRNGMIRLAQSEVDYAESAGKRIRVAAETGKSSEGAHLSFYGMDDNYMEEQLKMTEQAFNHTDSFSGLAIHSLESWMKRK